MASLFPKGLEWFVVKTAPEDGVTIKGLKCGTGPPLLLIHGFPQTHVIWHKVAHALIGSYTLVIPDLRGYGASSKPSSPDPNDHTLYAKSRMAGDMAALMTEFGHPSYYVVGHDRGARVAHKLCVDHPSRVRKVLFLDVVPTLTMFEQTDQLFATAYWHWFWLIQPAPFPEDAMVAAPDVYAGKMLRGLPKGTKTQGGVFEEAAFREYRKMFGDWATAHGMCEDYRAAATEDLKEQKADIQAGRKIKCPIRVLWGKAGLIERKFNGKEDWQKVSDGPVDERSRALDCGHYVPEEASEELVQDILEFCKD